MLAQRNRDASGLKRRRQFSGSEITFRTDEENDFGPASLDAKGINQIFTLAGKARDERGA